MIVLLNSGLNSAHFFFLIFLQKLEDEINIFLNHFCILWEIRPNNCYCYVLILAFLHMVVFIFNEFIKYS